MYKTWLKGARLLRRKSQSKAITAELKRCLRAGIRPWWEGRCIRATRGLFFIRKVQEVLFLKRKKKVAPYREFAVPKKNFTVIVDREQWREMMAMRTQDVRT